MKEITMGTTDSVVYPYRYLIEQFGKEYYFNTIKEAIEFYPFLERTENDTIVWVWDTLEEAWSSYALPK